jgi:surfeit locus 1 family protein
MVNKNRGLGPWRASIVFTFLAAIAISLGVWQLGRAAEKRAIIDAGVNRASVMKIGQREALWRPALTAAGLDQQQVILDGRWLFAQSIALDNRSLDGRFGVHVLTPLLLADGSLVWVNRGWMPSRPGQSQAPELPHAPDAANLSGVAQASVMRRMELSSDTAALRASNLWQNFDWDAATDRLAQAGLESRRVWPVIVWQSGEDTDGLVRRIPQVSNDPPKHLGYALQWFLMAVVALFFAWRLRPRPASTTLHPGGTTSSSS